MFFTKQNQSSPDNNLCDLVALKYFASLIKLMLKRFIVSKQF